MKHCIISKFKPEIGKEQKAAMLPEIKTLFEGLLGIDGIHGVEVIPNCVDRANRYDLLIRIDMEEAALPVYDESELHHKWKDQYGDFLEKKAIFDYE